MKITVYHGGNAQVIVNIYQLDRDSILAKARCKIFLASKESTINVPALPNGLTPC